MTSSRILLLAIGAAVLSACASGPAVRAPAGSAPSVLGHDLRVDVELDGQRVGGGQGTWLEPGLVLTTLDAVNDVPPTGELVVRASDGTRLSASVWTAGNPNDANVAYLFVHHPDRFGDLAKLSRQALCPAAPPALLVAHPGETAQARLAVDRFDAGDPSVSGTVLRGPGGCIAGLLAIREDALTVVPLDALHLVAKSLPSR